MTKNQLERAWERFAIDSLADRVDDWYQEGNIDASIEWGTWLEISRIAGNTPPEHPWLMERPFLNAWETFVWDRRQENGFKEWLEERFEEVI